MTKRQMHLGFAMYNYGTHAGGWKLSQHDIATNIAHFVKLAQRAEAAKFDMIFRADAPSSRIEDLDIRARNPGLNNAMEPLMFFSALSQATTHIGLASTLSTTFNPPYNLARQLATLDHISGGRAAWNAVTSAHPETAHNWGMDDLPPKAERYARAREFVEVVKRLWDTYEDDAILHDVDGGYYFDPDKLHITDFEGEHIKLYGALNVARCPQGRPVMIQAGASPDGLDFAAHEAEVIFAMTSTLEKSKQFYADMKARTVAAGRGENALKIVPGLNVIVADSRAEAEARYRRLEDLTPDDVKAQHFSQQTSINVVGLPMDEPVPLEVIPPSTRMIKSFFERGIELIETRRTLREIVQEYSFRPNAVVMGTAAEISDHMEEWIDENAADGFNVITPYGAEGFYDFCDQVIPELQRRGRFRTEYSGPTLRDHFGLERPEWRAYD